MYFASQALEVGRGHPFILLIGSLISLWGGLQGVWASFTSEPLIPTLRSGVAVFLSARQFPVIDVPPLLNLFQLIGSLAWTIVGVGLLAALLWMWGDAQARHSLSAAPKPVEDNGPPVVPPDGHHESPLDKADVTPGIASHPPSHPPPDDGPQLEPGTLESYGTGYRMWVRNTGTRPARHVRAELVEIPSSAGYPRDARGRLFSWANGQAEVDIRPSPSLGERVELLQSVYEGEWGVKPLSYAKNLDGSEPIELDRLMAGFMTRERFAITLTRQPLGLDVSALTHRFTIVVSCVEGSSYTVHFVLRKVEGITPRAITLEIEEPPPPKGPSA
jgi:hypothetical protein